MIIGPSFGDEILAAGLGGLPFSWGSDGVFGTENLTIAQNATLNTVIATHDSTKKISASILSQDLMAQLTVADYSAIKTAIAANDSFGLLWSTMQAQKDPMIVTNARFVSGWAALVQVLGQPRMTAISTALGVTIV
jgi:hypothetical protein